MSVALHRLIAVDSAVTDMIPYLNHILFMGLELSAKKTESTGHGQKPHERVVRARVGLDTSSRLTIHLRYAALG